MHTGMLWFDNDSKKTLALKITRAIDYYREKYGVTPDTVLVHPSMLEKQTEDNGFRDGKFLYRPSAVPKKDEVGFEPMQKDIEIVVRPYRPVLPGHIWVGIEEEKS
jgi:hypothetical protein